MRLLTILIFILTKGGGGGSRGGGMGRSSNGTGGRCGKDCDKELAIRLGIVFGMMLIFIIIYFIYPSYLSKRFKAKLIRARNKFFVEGDKSAISFPLQHVHEQGPWIEKTNMADEESGDRKSKPVPISGYYTVTYTEHQNECSSKRGRLHVVFTEANNGKGYKLSGSYDDDDGFAIIKEGFVCYDGTNAYWYEYYECPSTSLRCNLKHLKVLNEGTFDFRNNFFKGTWQSNTGFQGKILKLELCD